MTSLNIITLIGGLALFIYGVQLMSGGMQSIAGSKLRAMLGAVVRHRSAGLFVGLILTFFLQSSSASTVMFVSLVQGGILAFKDTISLILGAMIGTTLTVQIIAFNVSDYALAAVAAGVAMHLFGKHEKNRQWSNIILGIGMIFFGMAVMKTGIAPLRNDPSFVKWLNTTVGAPWISFLAATIFTAVVQASSATIAIVISFACSGLLGNSSQEILIAALPFIMGANVGTTITAVLASMHTGREAFRCALAHTIMKLFGAVVCMFLIVPIADMTIWLTSALWREEVHQSRIVANSHTLFNLLNVIVYLPFTGLIARFFIFLLPEQKERKIFAELTAAGKSSVSFNDEYNNLLQALSQYSGMVRKQIISLSGQFSTTNLTKLEIVSSGDEELDIAYREIRNHALLLYRLPSTKKYGDLLIPIIRSSELLERLGDDFDRSIVRSLKKIIRGDIKLSIESIEELKNVSRKIGELLNRYSEAVKNRNPDDVNLLLNKTVEIKKMIVSMRKSHFQALADNVPAAIKSSGYYIDILSELESSTVKIKVIVKLMNDYLVKSI